MSYNLIINVFACPTIETYKNEIIKINETWGATAAHMGVKVLFFFGEEQTDLIGDNYIYLPNIKNDYNSASWKQYLGFKHIYENYDFKFIFTCGTDTFINIEQLLLYLDNFDYNKKLYIGGHGCYVNVFNDSNIYFHNGGAGFILTKKILEELYPIIINLQIQWEFLCIEKNSMHLFCACDISIAYFLPKYINDYETIISEDFYNCNYLGYLKHFSCCLQHFSCCVGRFEIQKEYLSNIKKIISCHNMKEADFDNFQKILDNKNIDDDKFAIYIKYLSASMIPSDINEHLPILYELATECNSILELGVRGSPYIVASWAFANGLIANGADNGANNGPRILYLNSLHACNIGELLNHTNNPNLNIDIKYQCVKCLDLEFSEDMRFDMVFIDTWHVYGQLKRELAKFSKIANKYIVMHDTTVDEFDGETIRCGLNAHQQSEETGIPVEEILQGLGKAIDEFLADDNNSNWKLKKKYTNNHGLTILENSY
jgi:hypothetical protein